MQDGVGFEQPAGERRDRIDDASAQWGSERLVQPLPAYARSGRRLASIEERSRSPHVHFRLNDPKLQFHCDPLRNSRAYLKETLERLKALALHG